VSKTPDADADADLELDPPLLAARFRHALVPLARQLRTQVEGDMTPGLMSALGTVAREGPITLGDLAAVEKVTPPMATKLAGGLVSRGLVARVRCDADRRVVRLALSADGRSLLDRSASRRTAWLATRIAELGTTERAALARAVEVIERLNREGERTS
jgi:DNA-binding MarR family transcriptional regulator